MIENLYTWWDNIYGWYIENESAIAAFFMSGQFVSLIAALTMLVKNVKQVKSNTASTEKLDTTLNNTNEMADKIIILENDISSLTESNKSLSTELATTREKLQESNDLITNKLNAIIEVQSIVYTTIRDDSVRQTVNTILNNARYSEKNFKENLEIQIEGIRKEFESKMATMSESVNAIVDDVEKSINAAEVAKDRAKELNNEPTRY